MQEEPTRPGEEDVVPDDMTPDPEDDDCDIDGCGCGMSVDEPTADEDLPHCEGGVE